MRTTSLALSMLVAAASIVACKNPVCSFRGTINQPENLTMRREMLRTAMGDVCKSMTSRNAPLRFSVDSPIMGRFYTTQCQATEGETLNVTFSGYGYAWTNMSKKLTFFSSGVAGYRYDFQVTEQDRCDVYAYFRPSRIDTTNFTTHRIEGAMASVFNSLSSFGDNFGKQLFAGKLREGFTVIARDGNERNMDFALGLVPLGKRPFHPFQVEASDGRLTYENDRTEVHQDQRDFVGPILVEGSGKKLIVKARVDGVPAIDVMLMRRAEGEASLRLYHDYAQSGPLAGAPFDGQVLQAGVEMNRAVSVGPGMYYVVFDNTPSAGLVAPPVTALDDRAAVVNYLIQIGDAS